MNILYIVGFYPEIGGPFIAIKELAKKLSEKGIKVKVLSPIPKNYNKKKLEFTKELSFEVEYIEEQLPRFIMPSFSMNFFNAIKNSMPDIIHLNMPFDFYNIATFLLDKKYILSTRGSFMKEAYNMKVFKKIKKDLYMKIIGKKILQKASLIHVLTDEEEKHFLEFYPEFKSKIKIIPNGLDFSMYDNFNNNELTQKYPHLIGKKIILFLSRINWKKGLDILIKGFAKLYQERKDIHLVIVGKDDGDNYEKKVKHWVDACNISESVTFMGLLTGNDKLSVFYNSDVFILPSYSENFGVAVVEAMACKLPIIVSDKVGIANDIRDYKAGFVINASVEGVYTGLKYYLDNTNEFKKMAENGKKYVMDKYDINITADKMIDLYSEVMKN